MAEATGKRARGRPKSKIKGDAILVAARDLFLEHGYSQTSIEMVAAAAGVGKPTIYSHFGSKEELFDAIIAVRREVLMSKIRGITSPTDDPRADLEQFVSMFQELVLNPGARRWDRLVIAEAGRQPQLARTLFKAGPANVLLLIQRYIESQMAAGLLQVPDPALAAEHLLGLCFGAELVRGQMASQPERTSAERDARAKAAVTVFLAAYGTQSTRSSR